MNNLNSYPTMQQVPQQRPQQIQQQQVPYGYNQYGAWDNSYVRARQQHDMNYCQGQQNTNNNNININNALNQNFIWVDGVEGAKAYIIDKPNSTALLMDISDNFFYMKETDGNGIPAPVRIFEFKEITPVNNNIAVIDERLKDYVSKEEFNELKTLIVSLSNTINASAQALDTKETNLNSNNYIIEDKGESKNG